MHQVYEPFELLSYNISIDETLVIRGRLQTFESRSAADSCEAKKSWYSKVGKERTCSSSGTYC